MDPVLILMIGMIVSLLVVFLILIRMIGSLLQKVGPNEALIVSGPGGVTVATGGSIMIFPLLSRTQRLSLEVMAFEVPVFIRNYSVQEAITSLQATLLVKVCSDQMSILAAAEHFLSKTPQERKHLIGLAIDSRIQSISHAWQDEEAAPSLEHIRTQMIEGVSDDLSKMGLEIISFSLKPVDEAAMEQLQSQ